MLCKQAGDFLEIAEEVGKGERGVEVVAHRLVEALVDALLSALLVGEHFLGAGDELVKAAQVRFRLGEEAVRDIDVAAVARRKQSELDRLVGILLQKVLKEQAVAERLAHLLPVDLDEPVVRPILREPLARERLALGDLVLVMGKMRSLPPPWMSI